MFGTYHLHAAFIVLLEKEVGKEGVHVPRELDAEGAGCSIVETAAGGLEKGRVGLVEDHAHADHAAAESGESVVFLIHEFR